MNKTFGCTLIAIALAAVTAPAEAKGCIKGALVWSHRCCRRVRNRPPRGKQTPEHSACHNGERLALRAQVRMSHRQAANVDERHRAGRATGYGLGRGT
jgi:hypothetical protein